MASRRRSLGVEGKGSQSPDPSPRHGASLPVTQRGGIVACYGTGPPWPKRLHAVGPRDHIALMVADVGHSWPRMFDHAPTTWLRRTPLYRGSSAWSLKTDTRAAVSESAWGFHRGFHPFVVGVSPRGSSRLGDRIGRPQAQDKSSDESGGKTPSSPASLHRPPGPTRVCSSRSGIHRPVLRPEARRSKALHGEAPPGTKAALHRDRRGRRGNRALQGDR